MLWRRPRIPLHTSLPLPSKVQQIDGVQVLRALAVVSVVWTHAGQELLSPRGLLDYGVLGVDVFFVISGFILSSVVMRERGGPGFKTMWGFIKRRLLRIFPIYWFFAFLTIARFVLSHHRAPGADYLPSFFLLPCPLTIRMPLIVTFSWTLLFEMFFYYVLALVLLKTVRQAVPVMIAVLTAAVLAGSFFDIRRPVLIIALNPILLEFVLGAVVAFLYPRLQARFPKLRVAGVVMTLLGAVLATYLAAWTPVSVANGQQMVLRNAGAMGRVFTWGVAAALIVGGVVFWSPSLNNRIGRLFVVLGTASYSAYLASPLIIEYSLRLLRKLNGAPGTSAGFALYRWATVAAVLALGWVCYDLIEWPMLRTLQAKFQHKAA